MGCFGTGFVLVFSSRFPNYGAIVIPEKLLTLDVGDQLPGMETPLPAGFASVLETEPKEVNSDESPMVTVEDKHRHFSIYSVDEHGMRMADAGDESAQPRSPTAGPADWKALGDDRLAPNAVPPPATPED